MRQWLYCDRRIGWFLYQSDGIGTTADELAGPFTDREAVLAGEIWGVPFARR